MSNPFTSSTPGVCTSNKQSYQKSQLINGKYMNYNWCLTRTGTSSAAQCSATVLSSGGSIMSVGGSGYSSTGSYAIASQYGTSKYYSSTAPYCVDVNNLDTISWKAASYTNSNRLCFSDQRCPSTTAASDSGYFWWGEFLDWASVVICTRHTTHA